MSILFWFCSSLFSRFRHNFRYNICYNLLRNNNFSSIFESLLNNIRYNTLDIFRNNNLLGIFFWFCSSLFGWFRHNNFRIFESLSNNFRYNTLDIFGSIHNLRNSSRFFFIYFRNTNHGFGFNSINKGIRKIGFYSGLFIYGNNIIDNLLATTYRFRFLFYNGRNHNIRNHNIRNLSRRHFCERVRESE